MAYFLFLFLHVRDVTGVEGELESIGERISREEWRCPWLYSWIQVASRRRAWTLVVKCSSWRSSNSRVECRLSITALSSAVPTRPLNWVTPQRAQRHCCVEGLGWGARMAW